MRIGVGRVSQISETESAAVGDGRAIVVRVGGEIRAYRNRCPDGGAHLADAPVIDGIITCPAHRWNYRVADGGHVDSSQKLERLPVEVVNGEAFVMMPDTDLVDRPERLLAADRDDTWPNGIQRPTSQ